MAIPTITPKTTGALSYICIDDYSQEENEEYIFSRDRFKETSEVISSLRNIDDDDFKDIGGKFTIVADNKNDAYITAVAIAQVFTERGIDIGNKIVLCRPHLLIDSGMFAMNKNQPIVVEPSLDEIHSKLYEVDDFSDCLEKENVHGLDFYFTTPEKADEIPSDTMSWVITIGGDENLLPEQIFIEYFESRDYNVEMCAEELMQLSLNMSGKDEYYITSVAAKLVNDHLFNNPFNHTLTPEDFKNVLKKKKPVRRKVSNTSLIGLNEERAKLKAILTEHYISRQRAEFGLAPDTEGCHIVFAGPPGTAKTTLAREYADSLAELNIISSGNFKECVKSDYIGQFVGQTTPKIERLFKDMAERGGGVLFFDEIYTLSEKDTTAFDKEAVASIVQNMENYRDKVYCVFAGYEKKMNEFLLCNQGLKSRITNTIKFKGYDDTTIANIFWSMAESQGFKLSDDCFPILKEHFAKLRSVRGDNFGNGREARNLLANAKQQQAMRIGITKKPTKKVLMNLTIEDISNASRSILSSELESAKGMNPIGFNRPQSA